MAALDRIALVTGATDGLGREVARELKELGMHVLVHGRDPKRVKSTVGWLRDSPGDGSVEGVVADHAQLAQVAALARELARRFTRLDLLVNNAGIGAGSSDNERRELSADGLELRFQVNYLAHFALTAGLLDLLRGAGRARVVNVASVGQQPLDFDDLHLEHGFTGLRAYAQSKLAMIMWSFSLAERLSDTPITVNALHPASLMDTKMVFETFGYNISSVEDGARAVLRLCLDADLEHVTGRYFDGQKEARAHPQAYDAAARARLWEISEQLTVLDEKAAA